MSYSLTERDATAGNVMVAASMDCTCRRERVMLRTVLLDIPLNRVAKSGSLLLWWMKFRFDTIPPPYWGLPKPVGCPRSSSGPWPRRYRQFGLSNGIWDDVEIFLSVVFCDVETSLVSSRQRKVEKTKTNVPHGKSHPVLTKPFQNKTRNRRERVWRRWAGSSGWRLRSKRWVGDTEPNSGKRDYSNSLL